MSKLARLGQGLVLATALVATATTAFAFPFPRPNQVFPRPNQVTILGDRGGHMLEYAIKLKQLRQAGSNIRFAGRCDSACTLYLSIPRKLTCVTPGASFGFHLPYGSSANGNRVAAEYMMNKYPGWVRGWIASHGGLTHTIKTMGYSYASRHLPTCDGTSGVGI